MIVSWNTTNACNMYCDHCYRDAGCQAEDELNTAEAKTLLEQIAKAGFKIMIFSGGEPLMRTDIVELVAYATSLGLRPVFGTNGTLITLELAQQLKEAGAMGMGISLDSLDKQKHDEFRKFPGAWEGAVRGMKICKEVGLPFQIHTTIMDWNAHEVEAITDFAVELGAVAHHFFFLVPTGRAVSIEEETLKAEAYEEMLTRIMKKQQTVDIELKPTCAPQFMRIAKQMGIDMRFSRGCLAGTHYCIIGPKGQVQPCAYLNIPLGDVRETPFDEIWRNHEVFNTLRTLDYKGGCGSCGFKRACGGCRARAAFYNEGDYMAEEPWCLYHGRKGFSMDSIDRALLNAIQDRFPIAVHPYQILGEAVGTTEDDAFKRIQRLRQEGIIRRLGGIFDSRSLGYYSTLCAAKVPVEKIPILANLLEGIPGVTHNYIRNHEYNVWFTLIARSQAIAESILHTIREVSGVPNVFSLPAIRLFKINVNFDFDLSDEESSPEEGLDTFGDADLRSAQKENVFPYNLTNEDIALIRVLQGNLPDSPTPFTVLAEKLQWPVEKVIACANRLLNAEVTRRFGAVLRHQKAGFVANAMGVWQVNPEEAAEVGEIMARFKEVSHCYQRPTLPDWPYNLFTMIHGRTVEDCGEVMRKISLATGVKTYSMLFSTAELKKSSMQYFLEEEIN